jgi:hypothetical protein
VFVELNLVGLAQNIAESLFEKLIFELLPIHFSVGLNLVELDVRNSVSEELGEVKVVVSQEGDGASVDGHRLVHQGAPGKDVENERAGKVLQFGLVPFKCADAELKREKFLSHGL